MSVRLKFVACLVIAILGVATVGFLELNSEEIQVPLLGVIVFSSLLSLLMPSRWLLWAGLTGCTVFGTHIIAGWLGWNVKYPPEPNVWVTLITLIPAALCSFAISRLKPAPS